MPIDVTVALVGDPNSPPPGGIDPDEWARPWNDRMKAELVVDEGELLSEVIDRAAKEMGSLPFMAGLPLWNSFGWVAFELAGGYAVTWPLLPRRQL